MQRTMQHSNSKEALKSALEQWEKVHKGNDYVTERGESEKKESSRIAHDKPKVTRKVKMEDELEEEVKETDVTIVNKPSTFKGNHGD